MRRIGILALLLLSAGVAAADPRSAAIQTLSFTNGPAVLLAPDSLAGAVHVGVWYAAGSRNDPAGHAGLAYVLARGALSLPGEARVALEASGANFDLTVTPDVSSTSVTLPAEQLRAGLDALTTHAMAPALNAAALRTAMDGARAERRRRLQQSPLLPGLEQVNAALFAGHGYSAPVSGDEAGIDAIDEAAARADLSARFAITRALVTVSGRFDPADARAILESRFGAAQPAAVAGAGATPRLGSIEPRIDGGELALSVTVVLAGWRLPSERDPDAVALEVLSRLLAGGVSSRLNHALVTPEGSFLQVQGNFERRADGCLFVVAAAVKGAIDTTAIETQLTQAVERWARDPIAGADLESARDAVEASALERMQGAGGRAEALATALLLDGSVNACEAYLARLRSLTPADVKRAAGRALTEAQRTVVWTEPAPAPGEDKP